MIKKLFLCLLTVIPIKAYSASPWEGKWEVGRYHNDFAGHLIIQNCKNNECDFDIGTANGAHTCTINGKLKINGNKAQFRKKSVYNYAENEKYAVIDFKLNQQKRTIKVKGNYVAGRLHCGMQGYFEGEYENENNPLRFKTSFDCRAENISETEKTICADADLAAADVEMDKKYKAAITSEWKQKRDECKTDINCLWNFYVSSLIEEYKKSTNQDVNLYEYLGALEENGLYYPTDFTLLQDILYTLIIRQLRLAVRSWNFINN